MDAPVQSNEAARESEWSLKVERETERISLRWLEESGRKHFGICVKSVCAMAAYRDETRC